MRGQVLAIGPKPGDLRRELQDVIGRLLQLEVEGVNVTKALQVRSRAAWEFMEFLAGLDDAVSCSGMPGRRLGERRSDGKGAMTNSAARLANVIGALGALRSGCLQDVGSELRLFAVPEPPEGQGRWEVVWRPEE
jgi:hypothetical protein